MTIDSGVYDRRLVGLFALIGILSFWAMSTTVTVPANAVSPLIERSKGSLAFVLIGDEHGRVSTQLTAIEAKDENDGGRVKLNVFICHDMVKTAEQPPTATSVCGTYTSTNRHLFDVNGNLKSASLSPVKIDVCSFGDLVDNSKCDTLIGQLSLQVNWTGTGELKRTNDPKFRCNVGDFRMSIDSAGRAREADAFLSMNGEEVDTMFLSARIAKFSELVMRFGEPPTGNDCS